MIVSLNFELGSAELAISEKNLIRNLKSLNRKTLKVVGRSDSTPIGARTRRKYSSNYELALARGLNVQKEILRYHPEVRCIVVAEPYSKLLAESVSRTSYERRVDIYVTPSE